MEAYNNSIKSLNDLKISLGENKTWKLPNSEKHISLSFERFQENEEDINKFGEYILMARILKDPRFTDSDIMALATMIGLDNAIQISLDVLNYGLAVECEKVK